jgi:hypothetical protein
MEFLLDVVRVSMQSLQEQGHDLIVRITQAFRDHRRQTVQDKYTSFGALIAQIAQIFAAHA